MGFEWLFAVPLASAVLLFMIGPRWRFVLSLAGLGTLLACAHWVQQLPLHLTTLWWGQQWALDELGQTLLLHTYAATAVLTLIAWLADQAGWFVPPALAHCGLLTVVVLLRDVPLSALLCGSALLLWALTVRPGSTAAARGAARWLVAVALPMACLPLAVAMLEREVALSGPLGAWLAWLPLWSWWTLFPWDGTTRLWGKERLEVGALFLWAVKDWGVLYLWATLWQQYPALRSEGTLAALGIAGLATAVLSGVWALMQSQPAGVLACAAMSALGIAVQGLAADAGAAVQGGLLVLAQRSLAVLLAGAALAAWPSAAGRDAAAGDGAPRWRRPLLLAAFALGVLALAGLPPWGHAGRGPIQSWLAAQQPYLRLSWLSATFGIVLGLARVVWPMWHSEAEPDTDSRADLPLAWVAALLLLLLWVSLRPQGLAGLWAEPLGMWLQLLQSG